MSTPILVSHILNLIGIFNILCMQIQFSLNRQFSLQDWHPCVVDPYIAFDIMTVILDIVLLSAEGTLGDFSAFSKSIRTIRFLRLFRLLRVAGIFRRLNKVRFEGKFSLLSGCTNS